MATLKYYGIIAVRHSGNEKHPHYISHVFAIRTMVDTGHEFPGKLYTLEEAINLVDKYPVKTLLWNYSTSNWKIGAEVTTETIGKKRYLRSKPDDNKRDNLSNLIDYDFFG